MARDEAYFKSLESAYLEYEKAAGTPAAIEALGRTMAQHLKLAYDRVGFVKGDPQQFVRAVRLRDQAVGIEAEMVSEEGRRIIYRILEDPFSGLKGKIDREALDATYMRFSVDYLLGEGWTYRAARHMWLGHAFIEYRIEKADA